MFLFVVSFITGFIIATLLMKTGSQYLLHLVSPPWKTKCSIHSWFLQQSELSPKQRRNAYMPDRHKIQSNLILAPGTMDSLQLRDGFEEDTNSTAHFFAILLRVLRLFRLKDRIELYKIMKSTPVLQYLPEIIEQKEQLKNQPYLTKTADWLCYQSDHRGPFKIGLILQSMITRTNLRDLVMFGSNDETAYWASLSLRLKMDKPNAHIWEIIKVNEGWGRIQAIRLLSEPINQEIRYWLITEGYKNNILLSETILDIWHLGAPLETFNSQINIQFEIFPSLLEIYHILLTQTDPSQIAECDGFEELLLIIFREIKRVQHLAEFQHTFRKNLSAYNACRSIQTFFNETLMEFPPFYGLDFELQDAKAILDTLKDILDSDSHGWSEVIDKELFKESIDDYVEACGAAFELGMDIWPLHRLRLQQNPSNPLLWSALCSTDDHRRASKCIDIATQILPLGEIATGPTKQLGIPPESQSHYCLQIILNHLLNFPGSGHQLISTAMMSPLVLNRVLALKVLSYWRVNQLDNLESYMEILNQASSHEVDPSVLKRIQNLINNRELEDGVEQIVNSEGNPRQYLIDERGIKYWEPL